MCSWKRDIHKLKKKQQSNPHKMGKVFLEELHVKHTELHSEGLWDCVCVCVV